MKIRCVRHQPPRTPAYLYIFWKLSWFEYRVIWMNLQWCTIRWTFLFDWSLYFKFYLSHHVKHLLMIEMIKEPYTGLTGIFFKGNCVAIDDLYCFIIDGAWLSVKVPKSAPTTRLFLCLRLTRLKWSTMERRTRGWTLVWVMGTLLI
jgi:hypothetical protein